MPNKLTHAFDLVKNNPIPWIASTLGGIVVITSTVVGIDSRYVHAGEFKREVGEVQQQIKDIRKKQLDDELFKLEFKSQKSDLDRALIERYKRELRDLGKGSQ